MLLYTGLLRIGGGVMLYRNNLLLLYSLVLAAIISAIVNFPGRQKYVAIVVLGLALAGFDMAVPGVTSPRMAWRFKKQIERVGPKS